MCAMCWRTLLLKLKVLSAFNCIKDMKHACDGKFTGVYCVPKIVFKIELDL